MPPRRAPPRHAPIHATDFVTGLAYACRHGGATHPEAASGSYFPALSGAPSHLREGARGGDPGSLCRGISTRSVDDLVKAMGMTGISKSQVSDCVPRSTSATAFLNGRSRATGRGWWIDATYVKVREGGRIISVAVIIRHRRQHAGTPLSLA